MKASLPRLLAFLPLLLASPLLHAADFTFSIGDGATPSWNDNGLWTDPSGTPYPDGTYPGVNDTITTVNWNGTGGVPNLYLNGDRSVKRFETIYYSATARPSTRIYSGASTGSNAGVSNTLSISEELHHTAGSLYFRSAAGSTLTVEAPVLRLGTPSDTVNAALFEVASGTTGQGNIHVAFSETHLTGHAARLNIAKSFSATGGSINLGHVYFDLNVQSGFQFSAGITVPTDGDENIVLTTASLRGSHTETRGSITGRATLVIDPNASTATATGVADFNRLISGSMRVDKRGDSVQILSYANTYTAGTSITGGVLSVRNTSGSGLGTGAVSVGNGGVLAGNGIVALSSGNGITVASGGLIAPGEDNRLLSSESLEDGALQALELNNTQLTMESGSGFSFRVNADGTSDQITFNSYQLGQLVLTGGEIAVNISGNLADGQTYTLFTFSDGSNPIDSGIEEGLIAGTGFDGFNATFHYDSLGHGGPGTISMTVAAIPEPSTALLLLPVSAALLYRKMRGARD